MFRVSGSTNDKHGRRSALSTLSSPRASMLCTPTKSHKLKQRMTLCNFHWGLSERIVRIY
jgi:hypothetical protein